MTPSHDTATLKRELRARVRRALLAMTPQQRALDSERACRNALDAGLFRAGSTVLMYAAISEQGELDLSTLVGALSAMDCGLCVPRIDWTTRSIAPVEVRDLTTGWVADPRSPIKTLLAPPPEASCVPATEMNAIIVPGLAFDRGGRRLGRGAAHYDRLLAPLPTHAMGGPLRVAIVFDCQIVAHTPTEPHDRGVDVVVTPMRVIRTGS